MLVLSRKPGERVRLGTDITLVVLKIRGHQVHIGIDAPDQVHIVRQELDDLLPRPAPDKEHQHKRTHRAAKHP